MDFFVGTNLVLFLVMCWFVYYDRFVHFRGAANLHEFFFYACAILSAIVVIWLLFRQLPCPAWLLILIQIGILLHFSGAFFPNEEGRLYDAVTLGVRFDKVVHLYNSFAGAALACHLLGSQGSRLPLYPVVIVLIVLGAGAIVEILEYYVTLTVDDHGVGNYDNNLQDLIANLIGAATYMLVRRPLSATVSVFRGASQ